MKNKFFAIAVATFLLFSLVSLANATVKIGVLAKDSPAAALKAWGATGEYLTEKIGRPVEIVPLAFDKVFPAVEAGDVQFFLVNSSMFITAKTKYGAVPVATMINSRQGKSLNSFGGVVFTSAYNDKINSFADLKGKKFAAVSKSSFGGWQMVYKEFVDAGIDPFKDFATMEFLDKHDNVVFAVQNEQVDALVDSNNTLIASVLGKESKALNSNLKTVVTNIQQHILENSTRTVGEITTTSNTVISHTRNLFIVGSIIGFAMVLGILFQNARSILKLLGGESTAMISLAKRIADGDLTTKSSVKNIPGSLQATLQEMSEKLRQMIGNVVEEVLTLQATSTELALASEDMTGGAEHSSSRANTVAAATEEMSANMRSVTVASEQAAQNVNVVAIAILANEIKELAKQTARATGEIKAKIESIQSSTNETVVEISQISEVINSVNELVTTIAAASEEQSVTAGNISKNINKAASGISEVNDNVGQASSVANEIARDIAEISQVAGEAKEGCLRLQGNSRELKDFATSISRETGRFDLGKIAQQKTGSRVIATSQSLLRWSESLSVGISSIDTQHKKLVDLINELYVHMNSGSAKDSVGRTLGQLIDYTGSHFKSEEKLFATYDYPERAIHQEGHSKLVSQVVDFQDQFKKGEKDVSLELMEFLKDWLVNHIKKTDMQYSSFLLSKGVS